ncbi:twin-arginine translocase subunit TatC [Thermoactinomyces mirandus]|uniref:Sec-independent protein translocase protein TatC n=1 Tax=Thermoactinomyces mirandus TaxID=2756294 RepID=A0A7W2AS11_9BACL|nr:twin-arginine translocase subunit TatC [Thermoactinomyces mirandus]MBA4603559.1 twin-arginine translocase subunit TatC [Thermoactinomyces mirandus]
MNDEQPLTEHLRELRRRIILIFVFFAVALIVSFFYSQDVFRYVRNHLFSDYSVMILNPTDPIRIYFQISLIMAFILSLPVIMYHLWQFVRPGLHPNEQRAALIYIPIALGLFLLGLAFGYFVIFPYILDFLVMLGDQMGLNENFSVQYAFSFMFGVVLPLALFFELPVVTLFLTRIRLITPAILRKIRRFAYLGLVIVAAMITPPEPIANILVSIPLILLYEASIMISSWLTRRMEREDAFEAQVDGEDGEED